MFAYFQSKAQGFVFLNLVLRDYKSIRIRSQLVAGRNLQVSGVKIVNVKEKLTSLRLQNSGTNLLSFRVPLSPSCIFPGCQVLKAPFSVRDE